MLRAGLVAAITLCAASGQQPLPFPHDVHIAKGLECIDCHTGVDTRAAAGIPSVRKCMLCHRRVAVDKPAVVQLRNYAQQKHEIPWRRVYGFENEARVRFQHASHVRAGLDCGTCHGEVAKMKVAQAAVKHNMGTCLTCHRQRNATTDCVACHF